MKNRRGTSVKPKVLIDTTFLLPALGFEVEDEAMDVIPLFRKVRVYYLEVGILEAMWKVLKLVPPHMIDRVRLGIEAIKNTYHLLEPRVDAYVEAITIYRKGHHDYIDALHYTSAKMEGMIFLTIDYEFRDFLKKHGYQVENIVITPKEFKYLVSSYSHGLSKH